MYKSFLIFFDKHNLQKAIALHAIITRIQGGPVPPERWWSAAADLIAYLLQVPDGRPCVSVNFIHRHHDQAQPLSNIQCGWKENVRFLADAKDLPGAPFSDGQVLAYIKDAYTDGCKIAERDFKLCLKSIGQHHQWNFVWGDVPMRRRLPLNPFHSKPHPFFTTNDTTPTA